MNISSLAPQSFLYEFASLEEPVIANARFLTASVAGVTAHLALFIREEWHMQAPVVFALHVLLSFLAVSFEIGKLGLSSTPFINASLVIAGYLFGLFFSICVYRLSPLHRLHKFPGPRLAAVSKLWHVWQCRDSRNHELMDRLHKEYAGDFVRIGMIKSLRNKGILVVTTTLIEYSRAK